MHGSKKKLNSLVIPMEKFRGGVSSMMPDHLLIYDGHCLKSNRFAHWVMERNWWSDDNELKGKKISFTPKQTPEVKRLLNTLPAKLYGEKLHQERTLILLQKQISEKRSNTDSKAKLSLDNIKYGGEQVQGKFLSKKGGLVSDLSGIKTGRQALDKAMTNPLVGEIKFDIIVSTNALAVTTIVKDLIDRQEWRWVGQFIHNFCPLFVAEMMIDNFWLTEDRYQRYGMKYKIHEPEPELNCPFPTVDFKTRIWQLHDQGKHQYKFKVHALEDENIIKKKRQEKKQFM